MSLYTMVSTGPMRVKALDAAKGTFQAYGAVFRNQDYNGDIIEPGAFTKTLSAARQTKAAKGGAVLWPLLWMHDENDPVGGVVDAQEDNSGLLISCVVDMDTEQGRRAFSGVQKGYTNQFSIGYDPVRATRDQKGVRHLEEIRLWEISVITTGYAANPQANVLPESVKAVLERKTRNMDFRNLIYGDDLDAQRDKVDRASAKVMSLLRDLDYNATFRGDAEAKRALARLGTAINRPHKSVGEQIVDIIVTEQHARDEAEFKAARLRLLEWKVGAGLASYDEHKELARMTGRPLLPTRNNHH